MNPFSTPFWTICVRGTCTSSGTLLLMLHLSLNYYVNTISTWSSAFWSCIFKVPYPMSTLTSFLDMRIWVTRKKSQRALERMQLSNIRLPFTACFLPREKWLRYYFRLWPVLTGMACLHKVCCLPITTLRNYLGFCWVGLPLASNTYGKSIFLCVACLESIRYCNGKYWKVQERYVR